MAGESYAPPSITVRQYVVGEAIDAFGGVAPEDHIDVPPPTEISPFIVPEPKADVPSVTVDAPFTEPGEPEQNLDQGFEQPQPTAKARRFSAPQSSWDATRWVFAEVLDKSCRADTRF